MLIRNSAISSSARDEVIPMIPYVRVKISHARGMSGRREPRVGSMGRPVYGWELLCITRSSARLKAMGGYGALGKDWNSARVSKEGLPL